jgi:hypothetical protein
MSDSQGTTCARCDAPTVGKSKYCREHRREARAAFKAMLEAKSGEREARYGEYAEVHEAAIEATLKVPAGTLKNSPEAYLTVVPKTSGFARWLDREGKLANDGTLLIATPKLATVKAAGKVLKAAGFGVRVEVPIEV